MAKETTLVYRLEGKNGQGVYVGGHARKAGVRGSAQSHQPMAWMDGLDRDYDTHKFGFKSIAQLKAWFDDPYDRRDLADVGVQVKIFEVSKGRVCYGGRQLTFNKSKAKLIGTKSLREI